MAHYSVRRPLAFVSSQTCRQQTSQILAKCHATGSNIPAFSPWCIQTKSGAYQERRFHSRRSVSSSAFNTTAEENYETSSDTMCTQKPALSLLPLSTLLRSYLITAISSSPLLLKPSLAAMSFLAHSKARFLNPDHNPVLHALLKKTFYVQFCAGETPSEVRQTIDSLKSMGYQGVILGHAREVVMSKEEAAQLDSVHECESQKDCNEREVTQWKQSTLDTINLADKNDFVALKFTGAGREALQHLKQNIPCAPRMREAIHEICQLAQKRGVRLLFDAEQASLQDGIDQWTLHYMQKYNKGGKATVYGTYQAYAKRTPGVLAQHMNEAQKSDFVLGVKLVRGAYLGSDPRELFWDTIEGTHQCYDSITQCLIQQRYDGLLQPVVGSTKAFPKVNVVLASHNADSVHKAQALRDERAQRGETNVPMAYGQLMGMADHVSCELVQAANEKSTSSLQNVEIPNAYKYLVWGTMGECMKYLLRRAQENKDAVSRTIDARRSLGKELARRMGLSS